MKKKSNKFLAVILSFVIIMCMIPLGLSVSAEDGITYKYYEEKIGDVNVCVAKVESCDKSISGDVVIPSAVDGAMVRKIGKGAFRDCTSLKSITLPATLESIELYAFLNCPNLETTNYMGSPTQWAQIRFYRADNLSYGSNPIAQTRNLYINGTLLENVNLGSGIEVSTSAFEQCETIKKVTINNVKHVNAYAFRLCTGLEQATIGYSEKGFVSNVGYGATDASTFYGCTNLKKVTFLDTATEIAYSMFQSCTSLEKVIIPRSVTTIDGNAFNGCRNLTIYGFTDSYAQTFAAEKNIPFVALDAPDHVHDYTSDVTTEPTCTETGIRTLVCDCGDTVTEEISAKGHSFGEWAITLPATCTNNGEKERVCACGAKETETIPATDHAYGEWSIIKAATCVENGEKEKVCVCGDKITETLPATGAHADGDGNGLCDTCGKDLGTKPSEEQPSQDNSFIGKIKAFFQRIIDWFKNLFG